MNLSIKQKWILLGIIGVLAISLFIGNIKVLYFNKDKNNSSPIEYVKEAELRYWECKSQLVNEVQNYIESVAPTSNLRGYNLVQASEKYDIDVKFMLAQAHIESHFGTKGLARKTNSVWNVLAYDSLSYDKISKKGKFPHPNASIEPYCELLINNYLVNKSEHDLMEHFINKHNKRYASDPNYESRLRDQYQVIKTDTKIDSLQDRLLYYKVRALR